MEQYWYIFCPVQFAFVGFPTFCGDCLGPGSEKHEGGQRFCGRQWSKGPTPGWQNALAQERWRRWHRLSHDQRQRRRCASNILWPCEQIWPASDGSGHVRAAADAGDGRAHPGPAAAATAAHAASGIGSTAPCYSSTTHEWCSARL